MTTPTPTCPRCNGQGGYLQKSLNYPDAVEWDLCALCDGEGVSK